MLLLLLIVVKAFRENFERETRLLASWESRKDFVIFLSGCKLTDNEINGTEEVRSSKYELTSCTRVLGVKVYQRLIVDFL